jgi:tRNA threonylcarbamoyladenosine biosynthesis protein TsaB
VPASTEPGHAADTAEMDPPPRLLIIETSGAAGRVGVAHGPDLLATRTLDPSRRHARDLAPAVRDVLAAASWKPRDVSAVFAGRGPGSYTGLRVGLMTAKAFAYAVKCDLVAVDSFAAIAAAVEPRPGVLEVVADALRGLVYCQQYRHGADRGWVPVDGLAIVPVNDWTARLDPGATVTGPGVAVIEALLPPGIVLVPPDRRDADLPGLLAAGLARFSRAERDDVFSCEPLYLRRSSAEENWDRNRPNRTDGQRT